MNKKLAVILSTLAALLALLPSGRAADTVKTIYQNNFEKETVDQVPAEFLVIEGDFEVKQAGGNKYLELPGAPLDSFSALFGPATNAGVCVGARVFGTGQKRRFPTFAVGLNGTSGYRLQVSPAKGAIEIYKGDASVASVPFAWKSDSWTLLRLRLRQNGDADWKVEGKAWVEGAAEPSDWTISYDEKTAPTPGRASIWGSPFSGTPIRYDDFTLTAE